jgi:hypothetical protein
VAKVGTGAKEVEGGRPKGFAYPCAPSGTKASLMESDSEIVTPNPGEVPQLFREPRALSAGLPEALRRLMRRWTATRGSAPRPGEASEPQARAEGPTRLGDRECRVCKGGTSDASTVSQAVARVAEPEGDKGVGSETAVQGAGEFSESDYDEGNSGLRSELWAGAGSSPAEMDDSDEETPAIGQSPGQGDEFARELAGTMSAIANLVVKATWRSVNNGRWLYFSGVQEDYQPFRARCQLFQETYHSATLPRVLVSMFREWNLSEEAARHIKGAKDMRAAWGMLDAVYDRAPAQGLGATRAPEPQWVERAEREALGTLGANVAELGVGKEIGLQWGHIFIDTPHGIRRLKCLWASGEEQEHTVVSFEAAKRCSLRAGSGKRAVRVTGPTGVTVGLDTNYEVFLLLDDLPGRTKQAAAHEVKSVGEFCGLADGAADDYDIQLGKDLLELLRQL